MPREKPEQMAAIMSEARPIATRAMAYAFAEADLRDALPKIQVRTPLLAGEADERSPLVVTKRSMPPSPTRRSWSCLASATRATSSRLSGSMPRSERFSCRSYDLLVGARSSAKGSGASRQARWTSVPNSLPES